ncbi:retrotransposon protein, putative, ty1-copia subclass [Tanacetum coccineum]
MTTTVVNNSLFRSLFEKQKLTGNNFMEWYRNPRIVLSTEDKLPLLEQPIHVLPVPLQGQANPPVVIAIHQAWVKAQKEIVGLMLMTMDLEILKTLEHLGAYDMLNELKTLYVQQVDQELLQTMREFHARKQEEGQFVSSYILKMKSYIDNLEHLGHAMTRNLSVSLILVSLRKEYNSFVQNYNMHSMGKTVNELHAMLKLHEQTLPIKEVATTLHPIRAGRIQKKQKKKSHKAAKGNQGKGKGKMGYAPVQEPPSATKPRSPLTPKKDNLTKDTICHQCGKLGHWRRNYPIYLSELMKKKKLSQGASNSSIFTIELYSFSSTYWVYDIGCGTYICIITQGLRRSRKLLPGALSLYVGDGHRAAVEAIGDYHLCLPSGFVLIMHNRHYAPSITRGIISVSRLYEDGFVNCFKNDNSIYHCHLGHINKKRIEKLKHDGLLDSTNIKSFEKCVACMFVKMARKPYSHHVKRAKDLLGLIQTDVCGPFKIMSRQGAYYFITFTDDFSRYGYVYLLKHKHEVFETFKVFQKEVENQHGKTIKSLRSIRRGYPKETMGYSFYYPPENKIFVARNAEFLKNSLINHEASGSLDDHEIIQDEDAHPSLYTSLNHVEDDQEIYKPQSYINLIRRSTRIPHPTYRLCFYVDAEEHELEDLDEPANYKAASLDLKFDKWLNAMNVEMQSMKYNEVWELVDLPPNGKTIGHK